MTGRAVLGAGALVVVIATGGLLSVVDAPISVGVYLAAALALATAALVGALAADRTVTAGPALACIAWCAPVWGAWFTGPAVIRTLAAVLGALLPAAVLHVCLGSRRTRGLWALYATLGAVALGHSLVADPFLDPDCRTACDVDTILVASSPSAAGALALVARVLAALVWSAVLTFAVIDFRGGSRRAAAMHGALAVAGAAGLLTAIRAPGAVLMVVEAAALLVLGTALVLGSVRLASATPRHGPPCGTPERIVRHPKSRGRAPTRARSSGRRALLAPRVRALGRVRRLPRRRPRRSGHDDGRDHPRGRARRCGRRRGRVAAGPRARTRRTHRPRQRADAGGDARPAGPAAGVAPTRRRDG